jgi:ubiquitin C-terminal hydrolase
MNSVIQSLYHISDLSNGLLELYNQDILNEEILNKMPMTLSFLEVIYNLSFRKSKSFSPERFKIIISKNESFRKFEANDSKTLTLYVLDTLNKELNENKIPQKNEKIINPIRNYNVQDANGIVKFFNENHNTLIGDLFNGLKSTDYICDTCSNIVKNYQIFNIITCSIEKTFLDKYGNKQKLEKDLKVDILDCFKLEEKPNLFVGNNQIFCGQCNTSRDGKSINKICISPKIMILFLDRGLNNRFMCDVDFPEELDINNFLETKGNKYKLIGVIEHLGQSGESGHFIANCKHFNGEWYIFSDSSIHPTQKEYKQYGVPYLLFYRRED